jgi:hypothetical protein
MDCGARRFFIAIATAGLSACSHAASDAPLPVESGVQISAAAFDSVIMQYAYAGLTTRERLVVRSPAEWSAVWDQITASHRPQPAPPAIDFGTEVVLVASMGARPSGGYVITIDSAKVVAGEFRVHVRETSPVDCGTTAAITQPTTARLASVADALRPVRWLETTATRHCSR